MVTKADIIINKSAKFGQNILLTGAVVSAVLALGNFAGGGVGAGILFAAATVGLLVWASKIKTTYHRRGGVDIYD